MSAAHFVIGKSVEARDIACWKTSAEADSGRTLIVGGIHGDEPATVALLEEYRVRVPAGCAVAILPLANPDGLHRRSRYNARGVDLNRNCGRNWRADSIEPSGPAPWSEPESRALRDFIESWRPAKIVSLHWALAEIDADGLHSTALAAAMWRAMTDEQRRPYRLRVATLGVESDVECPGSFGQWCGYALEYGDGSAPAMVTLELPADPETPRGEALPEDHLDRLRAWWLRDADGYLRAVAPGVFAMLDAACRA